MDSLAENTMDSIVKILRLLGKVTTTKILDEKGKPSQYIGTIKTQSNSKLGVLFYDWNRPMGVNKITNAFRSGKKFGFDGTVIISNQFSFAAIEQTKRINASGNHMIALIETSEIKDAETDSSFTLFSG